MTNAEIAERIKSAVRLLAGYEVDRGVEAVDDGRQIRMAVYELGLLVGELVAIEADGERKGEPQSISG